MMHGTYNVKLIKIFAISQITMPLRCVPEKYNVRIRYFKKAVWTVDVLERHCVRCSLVVNCKGYKANMSTEFWSSSL